MRALVPLCVAAVCAAPCFAVPSVFRGLDNSNLSAGGPRPNADAAAASFSAAAGPLFTQSFESIPLGAPPASFPIGDATAGLSVTATGIAEIASGVSVNVSYPASGSRYLRSISAEGTTYYTVTFSTPVRAFGFYMTDPSDWPAGGAPIENLRVNFNGGSVELLPVASVNGVSEGNTAFFGVVDPDLPISSFSISSPSSIPDEDEIGLDDLSVAFVPEPGFAAVLFTAVLLRRRCSTKLD